MVFFTHLLSRRRICGLLALALLLTGGTALADAPTRDEIRASYRVYADSCAHTLYDGDGLAAGAIAQMTAYLNFLRSLAELPPVRVDPVLSESAQTGAELLAADDVLSHTPPRPADWTDAAYAAGLSATTASNIASFNWLSDELLESAVDYFFRENGEENLYELGHRRWFLNPAMQKTGVGLAQAQSGIVYLALYAIDASSPQQHPWESISWPTAGLFPADLLASDTAWSVSVNPLKYDLTASQIRVTLTNVSDGTSYTGDTLFQHVDTQNIGTGGCIIFRPIWTGEYLQNQTWHVCIEGLMGANGLNTLEFDTQLISLYPIRTAAVEITPQTLSLAVNETFSASAAVIPGWADDLSIGWSSDNPQVATVDGDGSIQAVAPGQCTITAIGADGAQDFCQVFVD